MSEIINGKELSKKIKKELKEKVKELKEKGIMESGDLCVISGGRNYVKNAKLSKMIGGYVEI